MKNEQRRHYLNRAGMMRYLTGEEIARVSATAAPDQLSEGDEYVDLKHLDRGVRRAEGVTPPMARVLPRKSVQESTWAKIVKQVAALERATLN